MSAEPAGIEAGEPAGIEAAAPATFPGWGLRVALLLAASAAATVAMLGAPQAGVTTVVGVVMLLLVVAVTFAPGGATTVVFLLGLVGYRVAADGPTIDGGLVALVLLLPLIHQLAAFGAAIPGRSRVRWGVLRPAAGRLILAVLPVEIALLVAALIL